jgi:sulfite reductase beta subunit-like hemoprotein
MDKVKLDDIEKVLEPLFSYWNSTRQEGESFGSFTNRTVSGFFFFLHMVFMLVI